MSYLADVTNALSQSNGQGPSHLSVDGEERAIEVDSDWVEELAVEEEDSQAEDSVSAEGEGNGCRACLNLFYSFPPWVAFRTWSPVAFFLPTCLVRGPARALFWSCRADVRSQSLGEVTEMGLYVFLLPGAACSASPKTSLGRDAFFMRCGTLEFTKGF